MDKANDNLLGSLQLKTVVAQVGKFRAMLNTVLPHALVRKMFRPFSGSRFGWMSLETVAGDYFKMVVIALIALVHACMRVYQEAPWGFVHGG